ncbi:MAG: substrate-binding domain-containing protein [Clostridiales bacterium]|nr:substrate-binding domain-containing protein [Clostridiales bacterium]
MRKISRRDFLRGSAAAAVGTMAFGSLGMTASAEEKVQLKGLFVSHALTKSLDEMQWLQEIEEAAGVEIEWEQIYTDWDTVKSTRFASGDIPDILINATADSDYATYNGLFMELTDLIAEYAPNVTAMFEEQPDTKVLAQTYEGNIYALPKFQGKWPDTNTVLFINQNWLDNLGLEAPTTLTELKDVLIAFRDNDANGNGDSTDEIPLDFNAYGTNAWFGSAYSLRNLIGSWGIQITNWGTDGYFAEDGEVKCYAIDERYKAFIKYCADLYSEGLINVDAITNDYSMFQSLSRGDENGDAIVGCVFGWEETDKFGPTLYEQYVPVGPFVNDYDVEAGTYEPRWAYDFSGLNMSSNRICMSAACSNPEAAMRFMDQFYDSEVSVQVLFGGISDGCVEKTGDNSYKVLDPLDPDTDSGTWKWTSTMADNGPMYIREDTEIEMAQDMTYALEERVQYEEALSLVDDTNYYPQMFMKYTSEDDNTMALLQANVTNIIDNYWALWMTGESNIDDDWDSYVESVYAAGLTDILAIRQEAFDRYRGVSE